MQAPPWEPSPVPSDRDLLDGELPFTAWGQWEHGSLDLRVFEQDIYWVDIAQVPHRITEMSSEYRRNVIAFLRLNVDYFYTVTLIWTAVTILSDSLLGRVNSEVTARAFGAPAAGDITVLDWLEATPLMRRLKSLEGP